MLAIHHTKLSSPYAYFECIRMIPMPREECFVELYGSWNIIGEFKLMGFSEIRLGLLWRHRNTVGINKSLFRFGEIPKELD